jgi:hypothetical protein
LRLWQGWVEAFEVQPEGTTIQGAKKLWVVKVVEEKIIMQMQMRMKEDRLLKYSYQGCWNQTYHSGWRRYLAGCSWNKGDNETQGLRTSPPLLTYGWVMLSSFCFNYSLKWHFGILLKKQTVRRGLCFLPMERRETTVVSRACGHLWQGDPLGFHLVVRQGNASSIRVFLLEGNYAVADWWQQKWVVPAIRSTVCRWDICFVFASSQHSLCGFHLVHRSTASNPFGKPGAKEEMAFLAIKRHMKRWL